MTFRVLLLAVVLFVDGVAQAKPLPEKPLPELADFVPKLIIYLAKGPANSCGHGCDRWIAVEGKVDRDAAARVRRFLQDVKDTQRPIYFHSPGGAVDQSFIIGRLLRSRKAIARVGRTIVRACEPGTQIDEPCLKIKSGGGEVEAEIATLRSMCNSACGYLFLGATTREVAPDAAISVHNSKLTLAFRGHPSPQMIETFTDRSVAKADRERDSYVAAMGINRELTDLIRTVKFETPHILTRPELYRFGIDTRGISETAWTLESASPPYLRKIAVARKDDGATFRTMEWRLFCENRDRVPLVFIREFDKGAAGNSVVLMAGSSKPVTFNPFPARTGIYEVWSGTIASEPMKTVLAAPSLQMGLSTLTPDGKASPDLFDIDTNGLEPAWTKLLASCAGSRNPARPALLAPDPSSADPSSTDPSATDSSSASVH